MMKILVFSREEIETGVRITSAYVVISIRDPGKPRPKIKKQAGLREVLYLAFNDAEPSVLLELPPEMKIITTAQADTICNFVHRHKADVGSIVVHCEQGMSRSPAVAAAISDALGLDPKRFWQLYTPNEYVYHTVSDAFERGAATRRPGG
ncbi:MAG: hypothetical protein ACP5QA_14000 [Phycisphaerae bacterium]